MRFASDRVYKIVVSGDVTIDWNLIRIRRLDDGLKTWQTDKITRACWQRGGAALLADLITAIADDLRKNHHLNYALYQAGTPLESVAPGDQRFHHSYAMWSTFKSEDTIAWRVEEFLGVDCCLPGEAGDFNWQKVVDDPLQVDILVLDDANLGFRYREEIWPQILKPNNKPSWIVLKLCQPVAKGRLWEHLLENYADRLIVVTTMDDLRRTEVQISKGLSWERTAQDVVWELVHNPNVNGLSRSAYVVVSFDTAGAVVLSRSPDGPSMNREKITDQYHLIFDPKVIEGVWEQSHPGGMMGYTTCMVGGITRQLMLLHEAPDLLNGVQAGLAAMRDLHLRGYASFGEANRPDIQFPLARISDIYTNPVSDFGVAIIEDPVRFLKKQEAYLNGEIYPSEVWTILQDRYQDDLEPVSEQIVLDGAEIALRDVPLGIFGHLLTVDRQEIESFRSICTLVNEYLSQVKQKRPLSIAVFGAPGSGKSFGITQVANSLAPGQIEVLEFNLSQFESVEKLTDALHQVRDVNLSGKIPLVFWDEFDTPLAGHTLGWLRYFLAPMQDGAFREGQLSHPIGRSIFVFAGGTCEKMEQFGQGLDSETYRSVKVPDFVSRLKGFVNVLGPNRQEVIGEQTEVYFDPYYIIRRAILLRSILQRHAPQFFVKQGGIRKLQIDRGVMRAFLNVGEYKHGIRSIEAIVTMSQLSGKNAYERSSLPPEAQLNLHVDGEEFLGLVQQLELTGPLLEDLAQALHDLYCQGLREQGYVWGEVTDEKGKTHSSLVPYAKLPENEKEQNRDNVRHIAVKLANSGYIMIPARSNEPAFEFPGSYMDKLAEMEHERWVNLKRMAGWQQAARTDKEKKLHADLLPWNELTEKQKEKDRIMIRAIPEILKQAGYTIVQLRPDETA